MTDNLSYKIALIGDGGVGKTTFLNRHLGSSKLDPKYIATIGVEVHPVVFNTNHGKITFNVWDCAGQEKFGGLREGYYIKSDAAMVFFDVTSKCSYTNAYGWAESFLKVVPKGKMVVCGNKCDEQDRKVKPLDITINKNIECKYYDISAKTNYNFDKPFLELARSLTGYEDLKFITSQDKCTKLEFDIECSPEFFKQISSAECKRHPELVQFVDPVFDIDAKIKEAILKTKDDESVFTVQMPTKSIVYGN